MVMRESLVATLVLCFAAFASPLKAEETPIRPPPRGVVLMDEEAENLVLALSVNPSEDYVTPPLWKPSQADIDRLEKLLPEHMGQMKTPPDYRPLDEYYRQYAGAIREGKKVICVNVFHSSSAQFLAEGANSDRDLQKRLAERGIQEDAWLYQFITVSHGCGHYFTIEFDVETRQFGNPFFNCGSS
jgi:hypothetical protein